jgi:o-succinylbenzoate synthase
MKLRLELQRYRIALGPGVSNSRRGWREREGLLLELADEHGVVGQGETAPLPGYSNDELGAAERSLGARAGAWLKLPELDRSELLPETIAEVVTRFAPGASPSARFGVETALLDWLARRRGEPVHRLLSRFARSHSDSDVPVAAWIGFEARDDVLASAGAALDAGFRTLKLKAGRPNAFDAELATIAAVRSLAGPDVRIRLDLNRALPRTAAGQLERLCGFDLEFVEEPFEREAPLPRHPPIPLALDESMVEGRSLGRELSRDHGIVAVVLKPALHGGLLPALELAARAVEAGLAPIISHAFEGLIGYAAACELALAAGNRARAAGLGPHPALSAWNAPLPRALEGTVLRPHAEPGLGLPRLKPPR